MADSRRIVIAPDSFKGTASAQEAATALATGWLRERPQDVVRTAPMADGGEGTLEAMASADPASRLHPVTVTGPDGRDVRTAWLELADGTAVAELAGASGLGLLSSLQGLDAHTRGLGEVIAAALAADPPQLLVALGGSSSTDGGVGMLSALGAHFTDAAGAPIPDGARGLRALRIADLAALPPLPPRGVHALSDVTSPLTGPAGAAAVFGPQKGLGPEEIETVDVDLERLAALLGVDPAVPGAGAAGGTGAGLLAWGADLLPGARAIADALGLAGLMEGADVVITGEGRYDAQTASGKVASLVARLAQDAGAHLGIVAGRIDAPVPPGALSADLSELAGSGEAAMAETQRWLTEAGAHLARQAAITGTAS